MNNMNSKKFIVTILYMLLSTILIFSNKIDAADWLQQTAFVIMAYMGGNSAEWFARKVPKNEKQD